MEVLPFLDSEASLMPRLSSILVTLLALVAVPATAVGQRQAEVGAAGKDEMVRRAQGLVEVGERLVRLGLRREAERVFRVAEQLLQRDRRPQPRPKVAPKAAGSSLETRVERLEGEIQGLLRALRRFESRVRASQRRRRVIQAGATRWRLDRSLPVSP